MATRTIVPNADGEGGLGKPNKRFQSIYAYVANCQTYEVANGDVAEKYICKDEVEPGDIVQVCDDTRYDVEKCKKGGGYKVIGVVSTAPGIILNKDTEGVAIALKGKTLCKVQGPIHKGDPIIAHDDGIGISKLNSNLASNSSSKVVGISLEDIEGDEIKKIEIIVV